MRLCFVVCSLSRLIGACFGLFADPTSGFSFFGPWRNLGLKPGAMGAHCLHPLVAGCDSTTCPFVSACVFPCAQCGFVPYVCQKAEWKHASSGERTMLCACAGRPPSISCVKIGDLGVQLEGSRFSQKQHCSFQSKKKKNWALVRSGATWRRRREREAGG